VVTALKNSDDGDYEVFFIGWSGRADPDGNLFSFIHSNGGPLNASKYRNAEADSLLDQGRAVTDPAAIARGLVRAVAGIVLAHLAATFVYLTAGEGPAAMLGAVLAQNVGTVLAAAWSVGALEPGTDLRDALELRPPPAGTLLRALLVGGLLVFFL
jgi:ABC-type transport system substrate-binding protein